MFFQPEADRLVLFWSLPRTWFGAKKRTENQELNILSIFQEQKYYSQCIKMGACCCINKNISLGELLCAIKTVSDGNKYYNYNISEEA